MKRREHWDRVYTAKSPTEVSWFESEPRVSLDLIQSVAAPASRLIDIGGGASRLVEHLLEAGFAEVAVLDVSTVALENAKARLGERAERVRWIVADVVHCDELGQFDIWHDRAVFHFLTDAADRHRYVELAARTIRPGGHLIVGTFALEGPEKCSGLSVCRYDAASLSKELGPQFRLVKELPYIHFTPAQKPQQFTFCVFQRSQP